MEHPVLLRSTLKKCCIIFLLCAVLINSALPVNIACADLLPSESLIEHKLACSDLPTQLDSIAAACVLADDTVAFSARGSVFFYHFASGTTTHVDLHHPQLASKSDLRVLTILKMEENAVVIPIYDYQADKSYCVLVDNESVAAYSAPVNAVFECAVVAAGQIFLGGNYMYGGSDQRKMASWYCVMNQELEIVCQNTLTATMKTDRSSIADILVAFTFRDMPVMVEYIRQNETFSVRLNQLSADGDVIGRKTLDIADHISAKDFHALHLYEALQLSPDTCCLTGVLQYDDDRSFICTLDEHLQIKDIVLLDHTLIDIEKSGSSFYAMTVADDYTSYEILHSEALYDAVPIKQFLSEDEYMRAPRFILRLDSGSLITLGVCYPPVHGKNEAYIGSLEQF